MNRRPDAVQVYINALPRITAVYACKGSICEAFSQEAGAKVSRKLIDWSAHNLTMTGKLRRNRHLRCCYYRLCAVYTEH